MTPSNTTWMEELKAKHISIDNLRCDDASQLFDGNWVHFTDGCDGLQNLFEDFSKVATSEREAGRREGLDYFVKFLEKNADTYWDLESAFQAINDYKHLLTLPRN